MGVQNLTDVRCRCACWDADGHLWGGYSDLTRRRPWEQDTLVLVFSTTKGMAAMALAVAHAQELLEYDAPVARYWPEFAQDGKERVTVRQLLSHQAGIPAIEPPLDVATLADLDRLAVLLARQRPEWIPGTRHGYHGLALGCYEGELLRRVDPRRHRCGYHLWDDPRERALRDAVYACISAAPRPLPLQ